MRTKLNLRKLRPAYVVGALTFAIPTSAVALGAGQSLAQSAPQFSLRSQRIAYGAQESVTGTLPSGESAQQLELQYQQPGGAWRELAGTTVNGDGSFSFLVRLWRSGLLRVIDANGQSAKDAGQTPSSSSSPLGASAPASVAVAAKLLAQRSPLNALSDHPISVRGDLLPGIAGRSVELQGRTSGGWHTLASASTSQGGHFDLRYSPTGLGVQRLRVRFPGDSANGPALAGPRSLTVYNQTVASWYDDGGNTACGFHAPLGVANKTLPCGTKVTFMHGARKVTAVVDDRGPFVSGRDWDLNQSTAGALGVSGVVTLWSNK